MQKLPKLVVILGQTAVGKTDLSIRLAKKFGGEVISADSRQVYRGLDVGSAKITEDEMQGVPHHLLNVIDINERFSVTDFEEQAVEVVDSIGGRGHVPFLVGGSAQYIYAVTDGLVGAKVPPNTALRNRLEKFTDAELNEKISKLDQKRAQELDPSNRRRLIRAIEVASELGGVPHLASKIRYDVLFVGLRRERNQIRDRIQQRILSRLNDGSLVQEVADLISEGVSSDRLNSLGLEYRYTPMLISGEITENEYIKVLSAKTWQFAKRQMNWWKKDKRIKWFHPNQTKKIELTVQEFLKYSK